MLSSPPALKKKKKTASNKATTSSRSTTRSWSGRRRTTIATVLVALSVYYAISLVYLQPKLLPPANNKQQLEAAAGVHSPLTQALHDVRNKAQNVSSTKKQSTTRRLTEAPAAAADAQRTLLERGDTYHQAQVRARRQRERTLNHAIRRNPFQRPQYEAMPPPKRDDRPRLLPELDRHWKVAPVEGDPLRAENWPFEQRSIDMKPAIPYLGTLLDAGRHYFPVPWIKRLMEHLARMNYNLIHFRLTDDQTFNVLLESHPELAVPTAVDNPDKLVYTVTELRDLTQYAKSLGISIMPEVNVPGHAGGWAGGIGDMIVACPKFVCQKGYGLPLNVTHHRLKPILTDIIKEIVDIFDNPPFLHLGGDEVDMADPCFRELGIPVFDWQAFEYTLKDIIRDSGYPEERIVRWEMTGQNERITRAGAIDQFWFGHPYKRKNPKTDTFFVSTWMYFDTNKDQNAYEVYQKAEMNFHNKRLPTAIIAGTFELSCEFWYDRNILGRLLSVAIGSSGQSLGQGGKAAAAARTAVHQQWNEYCVQLGLGDIICDTQGAPVISTAHYHNKWRAGWEIWKSAICQRLTRTIKTFEFIAASPQQQAKIVEKSSQYFWKEYPLLLLQNTTTPSPPRVTVAVDNTDEATTAAQTAQLLEQLQAKKPVKYSGIILDATAMLPSASQLQHLIQTVGSGMGLNTAQLRLISNDGFVFQPNFEPNLGHSFLARETNPSGGNNLYSLFDLKQLASTARGLGMEIIPEITVSSHAGGWYQAGLVMNCPTVYCQNQQPIPIDISHTEQVLPVLLAVIGELRQVFSSSLFHLGPDDRHASQACLDQAGIAATQFDVLERKLEAMLSLAQLQPNQLVRQFNNEEEMVYRAGKITQYPANNDDWQSTTTPETAVLVTIDLLEGNAYSVYQTTREAAASKPLGILANVTVSSSSHNNELFVRSWNIPQRILAYSMGLSFDDIASEEEFATQFTLLCRALDWEIADDDAYPYCSPPPAALSPEQLQVARTFYTQTAEFQERACRERTRSSTKHAYVHPHAYYNVSKAAAQEEERRRRIRRN